MICTYFSYIEYVLGIHLVKILLIFIKYEPSTVRPKGLAHAVVFVVLLCVVLNEKTNTIV